jgi:YD repeat-containing protein
VRYPLGDALRDVRYDEASRIVSFTHLSADGTAQPALDQAFGYDENSRLTGITTNAASWAINYDANGNRTGLSLNGSPSTYSVEATSNRTTSITNPARSLVFDNAGNTLSDSAADGSGYTATYNLRGQLATLTKNGVTTSYTYNAAGQRVRKVSSTGPQSTVVFVYDQAGHLLGEYDQNGAPLREYVWLRDTPMAMFTPDPVNPSGEPLVYFIHTDHLNTPRVVVDRQNRVRWRWLAEPFGTTAPETHSRGSGFSPGTRFLHIFCTIRPDTRSSPQPPGSRSMSSNERPDPERRGPSGLTTLELAELLPPLEPLPLPPIEAIDPPQTLWRVVPRLLFCITVGVLSVMHISFFMTQAEEPVSTLRCVDIVRNAAVFTGIGLLCAVAGAALLSRLKQLLRNRRVVQVTGAGLNSTSAL